jgi:nicotinamide riboside transporter PnuC
MAEDGKLASLKGNISYFTERHHTGKESAVTILGVLGKQIIENWTWAITALSIVGVVLNIRKRRTCFYIWAVTNASWAVIDYANGLHSQAFLFSIYFILAVWGIFSWR